MFTDFEKTRKCDMSITEVGSFSPAKRMKAFSSQKDNSSQRFSKDLESFALDVRVLSSVTSPP